jgi:hypothetical protein
MVAGTRAFRIEETLMAEPPALSPPPTRHALFVFLVTLALLLHVATVGWGDFPDRRKIERLLARLSGGSDFSLHVRHVLARTHRHARTGLQRFRDGRDFFWPVWLSAAPTSTRFVFGCLDLRRAGLFK